MPVQFLGLLVPNGKEAKQSEITLEKQESWKLLSGLRTRSARVFFPVNEIPNEILSGGREK